MTVFCSHQDRFYEPAGVGRSPIASSSRQMKRLGALVRGVVIKTKDSVLQTNLMWAKDLNEIAANIERDYEPRSSELVDATARFYASHFTEAELKGILSFYQSPLGQKAIAQEPKVLDESMVYAGTWADNLSQEVITAIRIEMKKRGHDM